MSLVVASPRPPRVRPDGRQPARPASLAAVASQLGELRAPNPLRTSAQAGVNLGLLAGLSVLAATTTSPPALMACWAAQGLLLTGCYTAAHDCAHGTFASRRWVNEVAGRLWASLALLNFSLYRAYHLRHHAHTGVEGDTEAYGWRYERLRDYLRDLLLGGAEFLLSMGLASARALVLRRYPDYLASPRLRAAARLDGLVLLAWLSVLAAFTFANPLLALRTVWAPYAAYGVGIFLTGLPEHYGTVPGSDGLRNTRTIRSNALYRLVFWNGNFHAEHHLFPTVPSARLAVVHRSIAKDLAYCAPSLIGFHLGLVGELASRRRGAAP